MIESIQQDVMSSAREEGGVLWFHPRACRVPGEPARVFMTAQEISGSDYFHPVHWMETSDMGSTWSTPREVPGFGRTDVDGTVQRGVCDVVPEYHPKTQKILAIGHTVFYQEGSFYRPQPPRNPIYAIYDLESQTWIPAKNLAWDRSGDVSIFSSGCAQRHTLENGDILMPMTFRLNGRDDAQVTTARLHFDGETCSIEEVGSSLELRVKRGLLEPTITRFDADGRYYLSIRAEDDRGYHSVSDDGLNWSPIEPWKWDDGEPLTMSTTQSRWLPHSDALYLVYTRRDETNANVMRWRAPLFVSRFDPEKNALIRESERIAVPMQGDGINDPDGVARLGNFHTVAVTPEESWVTVGETLPKRGYRGNTIISRIRWEKPNRTIHA